MAITLAHLLIRLGADSREFRNALYKGEKRLKQFADSSKRFGNAMTLGVTVPMLAVGAGALKMAMDAQESENLFEVSMGNMADAARTWSEQLREELGLNSYEVRNNVGVLNQMLGSMGLGEDAAFSMAKGMTKLSYDMASFFNLEPAEAFEKLQAGITGEAEPLKRLGILVNENTIKAAAYTAGIAKQGEALTEQQKVQARYLTIMKATEKAQGDLARTIDSPTNRLRVLKGQLTETAIQFGEALLPTLEASMPAIQSVADLVRSAADAFAAMDPETRKLTLSIGGLLIAAGPATRVLGGVATAAGAGARLTRQLVTNLGPLNMTMRMVTSSSLEYSSASLKVQKQMAGAAKQAGLLKAGLLATAAAAGYAVGTAFRPQIEALLGLDDAQFKVANSQQEYVEQLVKSQEFFQSQHILLSKLRKELALTGVEWEISADHTDANSAALAELLPKAQQMHRALIQERAAVAQTNRANLDRETILKNMARALGEQDQAIGDVTRRTREMYGVMSKKDAEQQMRMLVADFAMLAKDGVSADQLLEAFGPKVEELAEAAKSYTGMQLPSQFTQLAWAIGKDSAPVLGFIANQLASTIPDAADVAKTSLEGSIMQGLTASREHAETEIETIEQRLQKMADGNYEVNVKVLADMSALDNLGIDETNTLP